MNELLGLAYYTEIPAVIVDVQRTGPSTGMPTRTQQADILLCAYASHGDTKHIVLFPANPHECFEFAVAVLRPRRAVPDAGLHALGPRHRHERLGRARTDLGRRLRARTAGRCSTTRTSPSMAEFFRYTDEDEEFVTPRTLPGSDEKGAYFIRGSGHDKFGQLHRESPTSTRRSSTA